MAFLLGRELGPTSGSTSGGGLGVGEILLGSFVAPPDLFGLDSAPDSTSKGGEGVDELLLGFLAAPPDLPCSGLDPILDSAPRDGKGVGELLLGFLVAPPGLPCSGLDPTLDSTGTVVKVPASSSQTSLWPLLTFFVLNWILSSTSLLAKVEVPVSSPGVP